MKAIKSFENLNVAVWKHIACVTTGGSNKHARVDNFRVEKSYFDLSNILKYEE